MKLFFSLVVTPFLLFMATAAAQTAAEQQPAEPAVSEHQRASPEQTDPVPVPLSGLRGSKGHRELLCDNWPFCSDVAKLCRGNNGGGTCIGPDSQGNFNYKKLEEHKNENGKTLRNDISFVQVACGWTVVVYKRGDFKGRLKQLTGYHKGHFTEHRLKGTEWDNAINSFKVWKYAHC